ncbi:MULTISPECIES: DUF4174 domain-containing protein [unclassified Marinobacter]|jgi:hypothetical protein|uniref:DUF4174 domain-containing protein n=1 Tax=Marinobacter TaxID=2742 RepID=UPI000C6381BD|nr:MULTISPECIES: DUF4174 domain-containing protein [unclassified Marinobacter]MAK47948.1 hypothetical protein [Marinobacter sp.]MBI46499.1 hypothetical protein [Marinobacter sp.]MCP4064377.1 DUF4174 domain-containing protein [Gammaproteobacteria bacterium]HAS76623.1 hypothetical protein [Marinobacter adhaerens]|tara:strand:- start:2027 stop:2467 length:441 start_codon:yes stop_codon:yes gene_type:complete
MSFNLAVNKNRTILTLMLLLITLTTQGAGMNSLSDYQWKNRLILVQATDENAGEIDTLRSARAEVDDRDIVWFVNTGADLVSNQDGVSSSLESEIKALLDQFRSDERVLLIGKDGGMKSREPSLDLDAIFRRIDRMPMRMREMRSD